MIYLLSIFSLDSPLKNYTGVQICDLEIILFKDLSFNLLINSIYIKALRVLGF